MKNMIRKKGNVQIDDFDIATIEALCDLLVDTAGFPPNFKTITNARNLIIKMYKSLV